MRNWIIGIAAALGAISGVVLVTAPVESQPGGVEKLTVGIYTPTVEFSTAQARLAYIQGLAKAIESNTGIKTEGQSFASLSALKQAGVDFAVIDGQCYAVNGGRRCAAASR
jgi:hypothetical protein